MFFVDVQYKFWSRFATCELSEVRAVQHHLNRQFQTLYDNVEREAVSLAERLDSENCVSSPHYSLSESSYPRGHQIHLFRKKHKSKQYFDAKYCFGWGGLKACMGILKSNDSEQMKYTQHFAIDEKIKSTGCTEVFYSGFSVVLLQNSI